MLYTNSRLSVETIFGNTHKVEDIKLMIIAPNNTISIVLVFNKHDHKYYYLSTIRKYIIHV